MLEVGERMEMPQKSGLRVHEPRVQKSQFERSAFDLAQVKHVLVVGGSPERPEPALLRRLAGEADLVIACDAGADACRAARVRVDVLIGDDDSVSAEGLAYARGLVRDELLFPMDKDDVDLGLAIRWVREHCPRACALVATGVSGGRTDHALAVLGLLARAADLAPCVEENAAAMHVLSPEGASTWEFAPEDLGCTVSVVALLGNACVSETGMRWNLDHATLPALSDLGVSNVIEDAAARVTVHEGTALVVALHERVVKTVAAV